MTEASNQYADERLLNKLEVERRRSTVRQTHTYSILEISDDAFFEISAKLHDAGYNQAFHEDSQGNVLIDMHGIALQSDHSPTNSKGDITGTRGLVTQVNRVQEN